MTYQVHWRDAALKAADRFMANDPAGLLQVFHSVDLLAQDPQPEGSVAYGRPNMRRVQVGQYRLLYEIDEAAMSFTVMHLGRVS